MPGNKKKKKTQEVFRVKNMSCSCCLRVIREELTRDGITIESVKLGEVTVILDPAKITRTAVEEILASNGFEVVRDQEELLVEQVKQAVTELVQHTTYNAMVRNSDYIVEKFSLSYPYLSSIFSKHTGITLEKFIILNKIEQVKELIEYGELTLSEIAYMMGYSSVQYLSTQFKSITGVSVTDYKNSPEAGRIPLDVLGK
ncbi:MAG: AraC family transcriptional regulator [Bacteroidetes bacterium]|nr:MAG: AraC family transcriptional regulator [Bacteroidota bacterium]